MSDSLATPWTAACQASLSFIISWSSLQLMSLESVMPSNHLILCHPFLLLPSIFPSIRIFSNEQALHIRWPKYWSFSFSPSNEDSGLISFRIGWFDLLAVQGTLKSLLQHHSSKDVYCQKIRIHFQVGEDKSTHRTVLEVSLFVNKPFNKEMDIYWTSVVCQHFMHFLIS